MMLTALALTIAAPACRSYDTALPRPLRGWTRNGRSLDTGHAVTLPGRRGAVESRIRIRKQGTFGIAVDQPGWIDVLSPRGKPLRMASETSGPRCSTIRKIVRYRLRPGTYQVRVTRLKAPRAKLMLTHD